MHSVSKITAWLSSAALTLAALPAVPSPAHGLQGGAETVVPVVKTATARRCGNVADGVVDEETFRKMASDEGCSALKDLDVDFNSQTLIVVTVRGDCFVRASVEIKRDDDAKKYTCEVRKVYGGCRAAGRFERWVVVEKLRPEYKLEFATVTSERDEEAPGP
jgi:hypothetical protein